MHAHKSTGRAAKLSMKALLKKLAEFEAGGEGLEKRNSKLSGQLLPGCERRSLADEQAEHLRMSISDLRAGRLKLSGWPIPDVDETVLRLSII